MSRIRLFAAALLVTVVAVLVPAAPAFAHEQLVASTPDSGQRLEAAPAEVSLTFTAEPLSLNGAGMTVLVVDAAGRDWVQSPPTVQERTVTATLASGMPEAGYEVRWQVVSADGHPISGLIPFTIGAGEPFSSVPAQDSESETGQPGTPQETESDQILRIVLIGAGGAVLGVAALLLIEILRRRDRGGTGSSSSAQDTGEPA